MNFRRIFTPLTLLFLILIWIVMFLSLLNLYDGFGFITLDSSRKVALTLISTCLVILSVLVFAIRLIVESNAKWLGSILLLFLIVSCSSAYWLVHLIPTEFWVQSLEMGRFKQLSDTLTGAIWIFVVSLIAYIVWRWNLTRPSGRR
jgi:hypothetical protein